MSTDFKNNVTRFLDSKRITYQVFTYDYDAGVHSAVEVATVIGLPPQQVFKSLVALADEPNHKPLLVVIPGLASSVVGALLLLPPTRAAARPLVTAMAARRVPLVTAAASGAPGWGYSAAGSGDYIDGEVIDVVDVEPPAVERKPE